MKTKIFKVLAASLFLLLPLTSTVHAAKGDKEAKPANLADVWIIVAKRGQEAQFEKSFKEHIVFREKQGDPKKWQTYTPTIGDNLNFYVVRHCCTKWEDADSYAKWNRKNKINEHWNKHTDQYVASYSHYFTRVDFANSYWPEDDDKFKYFAVNSYKTKIGAGRTIEATKKQLSDHAKAMKWPYPWSWGTQIGGESKISLVIPYENYAGMTPPDVSFFEALAKHIGDKKKADKLFKQWAKSFEDITYTVYRKRDDMSMKE
ncbi:MAG: hypothetical protein OQK09_00640 [Colwellia sp.]|nr:hypothetical protein [Colwellia sp.]MCW9079995.1 hypothetical protein [Colwellia sp.]